MDKMKNTISLWIFLGLAYLLQSCSVNTDTTYFKDSATSMESHVLLDKSMLSMMNLMGNKPDVLQNKEISQLSTEWKSLFDIQKNGKITVNPDSAKVLKKVFLKLNKDKDEVYGLSLKYDKLLPNEVAQLLSQSKDLKKIPLQNFAVWNGKTLTIDTDKFNSTEVLAKIGEKTKDEKTSAPTTKSDSIEVYGRQMTQGMLGMMKMFNMNFTNTLKFQKPIKSIVGKHDFVKQIDNKTIQINVRSDELLDGGKKLINKDKQIIITTE